MKEAIVLKGPIVKIVDSPIPQPEAGQVVIKTEFSGSNPKDWKGAEWFDQAINSGDDIAGTIHSVGEGVHEFKKGDRVIAFHEMRTPGGSYAEYSLAWAHTTALLPPTTSFQEGATIPLAALTAAVGLYAADRLNLPQPWTPTTKSTPLLVYGAGAAVGSFAIQLAKKSNIHPIIAVAGNAQAHVEGLIDRSKGDTIIDYRKGDEAVVQGIRDALNGADLHYAFDCVSEKGSPANIAQVLHPQGKSTFVLPDLSKGISMELFDVFPDTVRQSLTAVGSVHENGKDFGYVYLRYFSRGLLDGWFKAHPQEVVPGGLGGVQQGLTNLKNGKASAVKYVFDISETEGYNV